MKWLKYRTTWSHGKDKWEYKPIYGVDLSWLDRNELVEEVLIEPIASESNWSEHFRGVDYEIISSSEVPHQQWSDAITVERDSIVLSNEHVRQLLLEEPPTGV